MGEGLGGIHRAGQGAGIDRGDFEGGEAFGNAARLNLTILI